MGEKPLVINREPETFASITLTENYPDALKDGYFVIDGYRSLNLTVDFSLESTAVGSVGPVPLELMLGALRVRVDAEDDRIDVITVVPRGRIDYDWTNEYIFQDVTFLVADKPGYWSSSDQPADQNAGLSISERFSFGAYAGNGGVTLGEGQEVNLEVDVTVVAQSEPDPEQVLTQAATSPCIGSLLTFPEPLLFPAGLPPPGRPLTLALGTGDFPADGHSGAMVRLSGRNWMLPPTR